MEQKSTLKLFRDARDFQILWLSIFLLYGVWNLQWDNYASYAVLFLSCLLTQLFGTFYLTFPDRPLKALLLPRSVCAYFSVPIRFGHSLFAVYCQSPANLSSG